MAAAVVNFFPGNSHTAVTSATESFDGTSTNGYLQVNVWTETQQNDVVSSLTYNSIALAQLTSVLNASGLGYITIWGLKNPSSGTNTLSISLSGTRNVRMDSIVLSGVDQTTPVDANNTNTALLSSAVTGNVTTTVANAFVVSSAFEPLQNFSSVGGGQTQIDLNNENQFRRASSTTTRATAGSETHTYTLGGNGNWCITLVAYRPSLAVTSGNFLTFM